MTTFVSAGATCAGVWSTSGLSTAGATAAPFLEPEVFRGGLLLAGVCEGVSPLIEDGAGIVAA